MASFDGSTFSRSGPDLRDISLVDMSKLGDAMITSDVVVALYPEDDYMVLRGESELQDICDTGDVAELSFLIVQVVNHAQTEMLAGAFDAVGQGQKEPHEIEAFRNMLASAQDVRGEKN